MAYGYNREEHAFKRIESDLRGNRISRTLLLCGTESYLVRFYLERLAGRYVNDAVKALDLVTLEGESLSLSAIIDNCETLSLMSERKVVIVPDFPPADGRSLRGFTDKDVDGLIEYLPQVPEGTLLIFTSQEPEGYKIPKLRTAIGKHGTVYDFQTLDDGLLRGFIEKRLRASGKSYKPSIVNAIVSETGYGNKYIDYTLFNLNNDLNKLAAYTAGDEITAEDVRAVISTNPENNIFSLLDFIGQNRKGDALIMVNNLFNSKVNPFMIQAMIISQLELMLMAKELSDNGHSLKEITKLTGNKSEFKVKKAAGLSQKYSYNQIKHILIGAYEIDRNIKTGNMEAELAIEYFISEI